jgi:signal transduction histidine kinase
VAVFAEDALDAATPTMRARSLRVRPDLEPATATGDPVLVERLVMNLIDNAVRHGHCPTAALRSWSSFRR